MIFFYRARQSLMGRAARMYMDIHHDLTAKADQAVKDRDAHKLIPGVTPGAPAAIAVGESPVSAANPSGFLSSEGTISTQNGIASATDTLTLHHAGQIDGTTGAGTPEDTFAARMEIPSSSPLDRQGGFSPQRLQSSYSLNHPEGRLQAEPASAPVKSEE